MSLHTTQVTSATNPQFKIWKSLLTSKGIKEHNQFMLIGEKLITEYLDHPLLDFKIENVLCTELSVRFKKFRQTQLNSELFKELDPLGTRFPILILSCNTFEEMDFSTEPQGLELVTPLGDPRNLGALTRTAVSFGARLMILTQESTHPYLPHSVKASSGAVIKMKFKKTLQHIAKIESSGENFALSLKGESILQIKWPENLRLWVGEEGPGLHLSETQQRLIHAVHIPINQVESLNAMVSASLAIWEWNKRK